MQFRRERLSGKALVAAYRMSGPVISLAAAIVSGIGRIWIVRQVIYSVLRKMHPSGIACLNGPEKYVIGLEDDAIGRIIYTQRQHGIVRLEKVVQIFRSMGRIQAMPSYLIDIGANIGATSIPAIKRGYVRNAISIEPYLPSANLLKCNAIINDLADRVTVVQKAVSDKVGEIELEVSESNCGDHRIRLAAMKGAYNEQDRKTAVIETTTIDKLIEMVPSNADHMIYMEIQGHEMIALRGITANAGPIATLFWPYGLERFGETPKTVVETIERLAKHWVDIRDPLAMRPVDQLGSLWDELKDRREFTIIALIA